MNIPLILTIIRLVFSPIIPALVLIYYMPQGTPFIHGLLAVLFLAMAGTDFFDGYLARRLRQETSIGKVLDPVADKMLVLSTLMALVFLGYAHWLWALIIMSREVLVMGLRELALSCRFALPVTQLAKYKSAVQYIYLAAVIAFPEHVFLEVILGSIACGITLISGYQYTRDCIVAYNQSSDV